VLRRKITKNLIRWKNDPDKMCLLVKGARQVGKTFIIDDFAKNNYDNYIYMNFELDPEYADIFSRNLNMDSVMSETHKVPRGIKLEKTNIFRDRKGVEHYPVFAVAFLFPDHSGCV
jgi:predicted AAA+ superfamily ATPase